MKQLRSRRCDPLQEIRRVPLRRFVLRPGDATNLRHRREAIVHNRRIAVGFPRIAPGPVDANPSLATRVFARHVALIVGPWRLDGTHACISPFQWASPRAASLWESPSPPDWSSPALGNVRHSQLTFTTIIPGHNASGRLTLTTNLARLYASPCLFQLVAHSGQQFVLRPQQELDRTEPLHHVLQYVVHLTLPRSPRYPRHQVLQSKTKWEKQRDDGSIDGKSNVWAKQPRLGPSPQVSLVTQSGHRIGASCCAHLGRHLIRAKFRQRFSRLAPGCSI